MKIFRWANICCSLCIITGLFFTGCKKNGNPNNLSGVDPKDYEGKIDGYGSSSEIFPDNLVAYWNFDTNTSETLTNTAPSFSVNAANIENGLIGKALRLDKGYLYFAHAFPAFGTDAFKSFTISLWTKILNNGSKRTMLFQLARPGIYNGNINFALNTNQNPASNIDVLQIQPTFSTVGGGTQDNLNNALSPRIGMDKWTHLVLTYDGGSGVFNIWGDGEKIGGYPNRGVGNNLFNSYEPNEVIIGANYNAIPGKEVSGDTSFEAMEGILDEVRIYNISLPDAHIKALRNLGLAGK